MSQVFSIPLDVDLSEFSQWLRIQGVVHRVVEDQGGQALLLGDDRYQQQVAQALSRYLSDESFRQSLAQELERLKSVSKGRRRFMVASPLATYVRAKPQQAPIIYILMVVSVLLAAMTNFGSGGPLLRAMLIVDPFQVTGDLTTASGRWLGLLDMLVMGDIWRLLSPDFLHFNAMHITFNLLMLWVLGGQLETSKGSASFLALVVFVSIISNIAQLLDSTYLFGGLSGVVYGLVGYCWLWSYFDKSIFFPKALLKFSLFWLLLGYTPLTEWMGLGKMANAAHLYGLISGMLWAGVTLFVNDVWLKRKKA